MKQIQLPRLSRIPAVEDVMHDLMVHINDLIIVVHINGLIINPSTKTIIRFNHQLVDLKPDTHTIMKYIISGIPNITNLFKEEE